MDCQVKPGNDAEPVASTVLYPNCRRNIGKMCSQSRS